MNFEDAIKYYNKIKSHKDLQNKCLEKFFKYIGSTWMGSFDKKRNNELSKYRELPFKLWNFYDKLQIEYNDNIKNEDKEINLETKIENYLSYTNNNVESINSYIKSQIPFGKK